MICYDDELRDICEKHGISLEKQYKPHFVSAFLEVWERIASDEPIAFYGMGEGLHSLSEIVNFRKKNVVCIVENNSNLHFYNDFIPVVSIDRVKNYKFNRIILTGYNSRLQMRQEIAEYSKDIEIVDVYEILERKGRIYTKPFFKGFEAVTWNYEYLEAAREKYINASNSEDMQKYLKELIQAYLEVRDFICADMYIKEYIEHRFFDAESYSALSIELKRFLGEIRNAIKMKENKKNIIIFILDSLSYNRANNVPFFAELSEKSFSFTNAFSPAVFTRASAFALLTGKKYVEDNLYKSSELSINDSSFIMDLHASGKKVKYISPACLPHIRELKEYANSTANIASLLYWYLLINIINESEDCVYFVHSVYETHIPFHSGNPTICLLDNDDMYEHFKAPSKAPLGYFNKVELHMDEALSYVANQMQFCIGLLNTEKDTIILTSDHDGRGYPGIFLGIPMTHEMNKVPLIIHSKNVKPGNYDAIYSTADLTNLLQQLMQGSHMLEMERFEYVRQEQEPHYFKALNTGDTGNPWIYGKISFITDTECYNFHLDGMESYCLQSDMNVNLIEDNRYRDRINFFRSQIKLDTRELWRFMFDKYPRLLDVHKDRVDEFLTENKNPNCLRGGHL